MQDELFNIETTAGAKALSALGASKGGKARADSLTPERRREIAQHAIQARWLKAGKEPKQTGFPTASHTGTLLIGGVELPCANLPGGVRVISSRSVLQVMGRPWRGKYRRTEMPNFLAAENLKPFIHEDLLAVLDPVQYYTPNGTVLQQGYRAELLPKICDVYLRARQTPGILKKKQLPIADACELVVRGLATVGIFALVDAATGYEADRARDELGKILEAYIVEELRPYIKTFPVEFFRQVYRIHGWEFRAGNYKHSPYVGKFINKYVYDALPPGVLPKIQELNPVVRSAAKNKPYRKNKNFQYLTGEVGAPHLEKQISNTTMLLRLSNGKEEFKELYARAFSGIQQQSLPLIVDVPMRALPA